MVRHLFSPARLARVGVKCTNEESGILHCFKCNKGWQPQIKSGGGLYRGYWKCPNGCNHAFKSIDRPHTVD
jgi:hypothetical protein